ncbi:IS110 family transposase [Halomonas sp. 18H]|uniref:IS110 family transposase n=3 Tax=unclassified Halomonas TaxID=2609666 RepID=UPI0018F03CA7|nr:MULTISPECIES: IS110 family transposase [unclassified Halomonas]MCW4153163.1 IS110 family transposase [Halomonas sp. 18H]QPL46870.1 IS110 family transposase [Halomonas sp. A40-4]
MAYIGIDVSKQKLDCLWVRDLSKSKVKTKVFPNRHQDYPGLLDWLVRQTGEDISNLHVFLEATSIYHEPLAYWLHDMGVTVYVLNPAQVRHHAKGMGVRSKTDRKDSMMLARYGIERNPKPWQPEPTEVRELKRLINRLEAVEDDLQRERNRLEKAEFNTDTQASESISYMLVALEREVQRLQQAIADHFEAYPPLKQDRKLLESIPGIGNVLSARLVATLRSRDFRSARQAAAFLGLVPILKESGTSVKLRTHLSKAGAPSIRRKLYMAAIVSTRCNPDVSEQFARLKARGKPTLSALGAAMRKLVHIAFGVLKSQSEYRPQGA